MVGLAATAALVIAAPASAFSEWVVDRTDDVALAAHPETAHCLPAQPDDCTLRGALSRANHTTSGSLISLPAGTYRRSRALDGLVALQSVTIQGAGARATVIQGAGGAAFFLGYVLRFAAQPGQATPLDSAIRDVTISGGASSYSGGGIEISDHRLAFVRVAVTGNLAQGTNFMGTKYPGFGGGIALDNAGARLTVDDSLIAGNRARGGTGLYAAGGGLAVTGGTATVRNSTIAANVVDGDSGPALGGGIAVRAGGTATLDGVTVAGNRAEDSGAAQAAGNIYRETTGASKISVMRSLIADGTGPPGSNAENCSAPLTSLGANVEDRHQCGLTPPADRIDATAGLGLLRDNGGPTDTRAITRSSAAFDFGGSCSSGDQRGLPRAFAACDSGAFEVQASPPGPAAPGTAGAPGTPGGSPPGTPAGGGSSGSAQDVPRCRLRLAGTTRRLTARIACDRAARVALAAVATIHARRTGRRRIAARHVALRRRTVSVAPGTATTVRLRVPRSLVRTVRRRARVSIALTATLTRADGGRDRQTATLARLKAPRARHRRPRS